ncbi:hypothetical protein ACVF4Y_23940 (plasmid) [Escherichia coli]
MNKPYDTALEFVNEIIERDVEGQKLRAEGKDGLSTWTAKDTGDAYRWLNGYVKALEDNTLITDEQLETLRKKIVILSGCAVPKVQCDLLDIQSAGELTANAIIDNCNVKVTLGNDSKSGGWDILRNQYLEYLDVNKENESKYDTLEVEDYMTDESVGRQVTDYRKHTSGRPLLVVFPEYDDINDCLNLIKGSDNEVDFALARDISDQLSIIVNAFEKDNAQQIIVAAAGEIQSLVQKYCIDRSH